MEINTQTDLDLSTTISLQCLTIYYYEGLDVKILSILEVIRNLIISGLNHDFFQNEI